jgi:GNAT superfamily N-acetyltransferase
MSTMKKGERRMSTQIEIVRAGIEDIPLVAPLFDAYRQFYKQATDIAGAQHFLSARLQENSSVIFLAYRTDEQSVRSACGFTQLYPSFSSTTMESLWILNDLFVAPTARRFGVGKALLERARDFGRETHAKELTLRTAVDNYTAQAVYEAAGWQRDEEFLTYILYLNK